MLYPRTPFKLFPDKLEGGLLMCRSMYDFGKDFEDDVMITRSERQKLDNSIMKYLTVTIRIGGRESAALIDAGSQIMCTFEDFIKEISRSCKIDELLVRNIYEVIAIGSKATNICRQITIGIKIGDVCAYMSTLLVIRRLSE